MTAPSGTFRKDCFSFLSAVRDTQLAACFSVLIGKSGTEHAGYLFRHGNIWGRRQALGGNEDRYFVFVCVAPSRIFCSTFVPTLCTGSEPVSQRRKCAQKNVVSIAPDFLPGSVEHSHVRVCICGVLVVVGTLVTRKDVRGTSSWTQLASVLPHCLRTVVITERYQ